ncbi:hypothetical protein [Streptomyces sp. KL110A]|uniref:hypothetical protein n=1 Tax=Streptomyces sp. KL110A TaxID=3384221 RepID=UPI0038C1566B
MRTVLLTAAAALALTGAAAAPAPTGPHHETLRTITPPSGAALDAEVDPAADRLYVSSSDGTAHHLTVYDTATGAAVGDPVPLPAPATVLALGPGGTLHLGLSTRIAVFDPATRTLTDDRVPVSGSVTLLAADPGQGRLYVGDQAAKSVTVYDTATGAAVGDPVVLPFHPAGLAVDTARHTGYATYVGGAVENGTVVYRNVLNAVDGATGRLTGTIGLGTTALGSMGVTVDPTTRTGYVANLAAGTVSVVDLAAERITGTLPVPGNPKALAYDPGTATLYAAQTGTASVAVVDPAEGRVTETLPTGERPAALALDPEDHTLYTVAGGAVTQTVRRTPQEPTPEPTPTPTPTATGEPTPTATPTPTPTPTGGPTAEPTDTASPTPTSTTTATGQPTPTAPTPTRPRDSTAPPETTSAQPPGSAPDTGPGTPPGSAPDPLTGSAAGPALASTGGGRTLPLTLAAASFAALGGLAVVLARRRQRAEEEPAP